MAPALDKATPFAHTADGHDISLLGCGNRLLYAVNVGWTRRFAGKLITLAVVRSIDDTAYRAGALSVLQFRKSPLSYQHLLFQSSLK